MNHSPTIHKQLANTMSLKSFVQSSRTSKFKFWNITGKQLCLPIKKRASKTKSRGYIILHVLTRLLAQQQTFINNISPFSMGWTFKKSFVVGIQNKHSLSPSEHYMIQSKGFITIRTLHDSKQGFHHYWDVFIKTSIKNSWISYPLHITITSKYSRYKA